MKPVLRNDWGPLLEGECKKPYFTELEQFLNQEYRSITSIQLLRIYIMRFTILPLKR